MLETPEDLARIAHSQVEAWTEELVVLRRDPTVRKFLDLQDKIDRTDAFVDEPADPSLPDALRPYDLYDAFEFARDLSGRQISSQALFGLACGRFPEMSSSGREVMMSFLIDNGFAEIARTTASGQAASYRFVPPRDGRPDGERKQFGLPANELSGLKADDLEDVIGLPHGDFERL